MKEDKQLLLKDLCARLPYGVMLQTSKEKAIKLLGIENTPRDINGNIREDCVITYMDKDDYILEEDISVCRPYLRPLTSMTQDEIVKLAYSVLNMFTPTIQEMPEMLSYLYSIHIDVNGLIEKGLAIEVTEEKNPYKQ